MIVTRKDGKWRVTLLAAGYLWRAEKLKDNGGPAFPCDCIVEQDEKGRRHGFEISSAGMSIRDHFAAKAMQGDWASQNESMGVFTNDVSEEILYERSKVYYRMAEAMLLARGE